MQSIIFLTISFMMGLINLSLTSTPVDKVTIEIINSEELEFDFSVDHKARRNQILIRSEKAIKSLRLMDADSKKTSYDVVGSNLVILPMSDFINGQEHIIEVKFLRNDNLVIVKVDVPKAKEEDNQG